jgi:hypothetical protein
MLNAEFRRELRESWLPNISDPGLTRIIELLEKGSPLLLSGRFTSALPTGCLATHIAWHHPAVAHRTEDAGILWLSRIAGLNPATSHVIREWDNHDPREWTFRQELLALLYDEVRRREQRETPVAEPAELVAV